ncbi:MAG: RNA polymerase sigma factor [Actinobacteria bacterium]|nr:RNA polymerase sigma factor [Actinomycetota bacterium]
MSVGLRIHIEPLPEGMWAGENRADAFEEAYRRCQPELVALCRRLLCGRGDAEAVAQEAFVRAWRSIDSFTGARPFWPWVATIARRLCIDQRRRIGRETRKLQAEATMTEGQAAVGPDELLESDEEFRAALLALKRLKPAEQRVITLREVNGWSYDEIAEFEGVTVESVRGSLKRARIRLRESYARVAAGAPAVLGLGAWRRARLRAEHILARHPWTGVGTSGPALIATDALVAVVALVFAVAVVGVPLDSVSTTPREESVVAEALGSGPAGEPGFDGERVTNARAEDRSPATPTAAPAGSAAGAVPGVALPLPADGADSPDDVMLTDVTPSPAYSSDNTVFAAGNVTQGCTYVVCPVLFRSPDRGRTWHRLAAVGFQGGELLLPASYPADTRIFAAGPSGLLVSGDGGQSFLRAAAIAGSAAISPAFSSGDPRILFGATPGWEYRDDIGAAKPGGLVLPSTALAGTVVFAPAYPRDPRIVVGGTTAAVGGGNSSAVFLCENGVCDTTTVLPGYIGAASVAVSPDYLTDNVVVAWRASGLFGSRDGGRSFAPMAVPDGGDVVDVAFDGARVLVLVHPADAEAGTASRLLETTDLGRTWRTVSTGGAGHALSAVDVMPDGRMLGSRTAAAGGGLVCSHDGGASWFDRCR